MDCQSIEENDLIERSLADQEYFTCLVERFESRLRNYVQKITGFKSDRIDDILQESFVLIFKNLNSYRKPLPVSSWIYRIVHNKSIDFVRKNKSQKRIKSEFEESQLATDLNRVSENPEKDLQLKEDFIFIMNELERMKINEKSALILNLFEGKNYQEISDILKLPKGSVGSIVSRGKKKLKNYLAKKVI